MAETTTSQGFYDLTFPWWPNNARNWSPEERRPTISPQSDSDAAYLGATWYEAYAYCNWLGYRTSAPVYLANTEAWKIAGEQGAIIDSGSHLKEWVNGDQLSPSPDVDPLVLLASQDDNWDITERNVTNPTDPFRVAYGFRCILNIP